MTHLGLIRHGTTDWNVAQRAQGHTDIPLNESGKRQASALAARLKGEAWDHLYASDLSRARQTAKIIAAEVGLPVQIDPRLREMNVGEVEGTTEADRVAKWGSDWRDQVSGIEARSSIIDRGLSFIRDVLEKHREERVLVVSHGALLRLILKQIIPEFDTKERLKPGSYTKLGCRQGEWDCEWYNSTSHLE